MSPIWYNISTLYVNPQQAHNVRKRDGDDDIVQGEFRVLKLVLDVYVTRPIVGRRGPNIDCPAMH